MYLIHYFYNVHLKGKLLYSAHLHLLQFYIIVRTTRQVKLAIGKSYGDHILPFHTMMAVNDLNRGACPRSSHFLVHVSE